MVCRVSAVRVYSVWGTDIHNGDFTLNVKPFEIIICTVFCCDTIANILRFFFNQPYCGTDGHRIEIYVAL